jgi:ribosomal protein S18 acetylase RimI-like enzyme
MQDVKLLSSTHRIQASRLIVLSLPDYYKVFSGNDEKLIATIAEQFAMPNSELGFARAEIAHNKVIGVYCALPSEQLRSAQIIGAHHLIKRLQVDQGVIRNKLSSLGYSIESIDTKSWYLSRIAVDTASRGSGVADRLMENYMQSSPLVGPYTLHVRYDNLRAIAFYRRHGFTAATTHDGIYLTMWHTSKGN